MKQHTVQLLDGEDVIGEVRVVASDDTDPIQIAATALMAATAARVDGETFTRDECDEWWA